MHCPHCGEDIDEFLHLALRRLRLKERLLLSPGLGLDVSCFEDEDLDDDDD